MKPTIIPDYDRYTDFTLEERMMLADLAAARVTTVIKFMVAKGEYKRALATANHDEIDRYFVRFNALLEIIGEIDAAIRDIYVAHGRVN